MTSISIVIVTWNSQETLANCVASLFAHVPAHDFELFVVDNDSEDTTYLDSYHDKSNVRIIRNAANLGYSKAVNIGLKNASGNFFLVLNPDIVFLSNPFPGLIRELTQNPHIGVIGPLLCDAEGEAQINGYYPTFPNPLQFVLIRTVLAENFAAFKWLSRRFFHARIGKSGLYYVDQIPGAFMLFHRDLLGRAPFNEAYFIWMEDVDFCQRVHKKGLKVAALADEKIIHLGGVSFKKRDSSWKRRVSIQSYLTYSGLYFKPASYWIQAILMIMDSCVRILVLPIFRFKTGPKKIFSLIGTEIKIISWIASQRPGPKKSVF